MKEKDFLPIILGSDENAYGTARLFYEEYGKKPLLLCTRALVPTKNSKLFDIMTIPSFDTDSVFVSELQKILSAKKVEYEKILIVPCSDYYTALISRHYPEFNGMISNSFISHELLDTLDTKDKFYALCEKYGMDYPKTYVAEKNDRITAVEKLSFGFPIVVKPENSNAYDYLHADFEGKKKVFFFDTKEEYLDMISNINKSEYGGKLIIQEFIKGDDSDMRVMNAYSSNDGKVKAMCLGRPVLEEYHPKTLGNYAAIISSGDTELYNKIRSFLDNIGYVGFSNIDMKYDRTTGKYYMMEINPRLGRSSFFVKIAGINMMKVLTDDTVYGKKTDCIYSENKALWSNVPKCVVFKYVTDPKIKSEMKKLIKEKKYGRTLDCNYDFNFKRFLRIKRYYYSQYNNFKTFYFDKKKMK